MDHLNGVLICDYRRPSVKVCDEWSPEPAGRPGGGTQTFGCALRTFMKIAIPIENGRLHGQFGVLPRVCHGGGRTRAKEHPAHGGWCRLPSTSTAWFPRWLREQGVGGGHRRRHWPSARWPILRNHGITVRAGVADLKGRGTGRRLTWKESERRRRKGPPSNHGAPPPPRPRPRARPSSHHHHHHHQRARPPPRFLTPPPSAYAPRHAQVQNHTRHTLTGRRWITRAESPLTRRLLDAADLLPGDQVHVINVNTGSRLVNLRH